MTTTVLLGLIAPFLTELVTAFNKKLTGTLLAGDAAYILSAIVAVVLAIGQVVFMPTFSFSSLASWGALLTTASVVWTLSQGFYKMLIKYPGMNVKADIPPAPAPVSNVVTTTPSSDITVSTASTADPVQNV